MPTIGNPNDPKFGPYVKVAPTNRAGDTNADDAPMVVRPSRDAASINATHSDIQTQILIELRVISKLLAEQNLFERGIMDEPDLLRADEDAGLGLEARS